MDVIQDALGRVEQDAPVSVDGLAMTPLLNFDACELTYVTLEEAIVDGGLKVTEVSDEGRVPELQVLNSGPKAVFVPDGEELVGAKQNRTVNLSILIPPNSKTVIPVTCVEAGRWSHRSREFRPSPQVQYPAARVAKMMHVSHSMASTGSRMADQGEMWNEIADKSARFEAHSETGAMDAIYDKRRAAIERFVDGLEPVKNQVGASFALHGHERGIELFDSPQTWSKLMPKIVRGWAVDAMDGLIKVEQPEAAASGLLERLGSAEWTVSPAVGLGSDVRFVGEGVTGAALIIAGQVVHLAGCMAERQ